MIVKNEETNLPVCLKSVAGLVDEIVIVDTGSNDRTKETAAAFTERIYDFEWRDDFAAARNFAFSLATCDYILWLDADDIFTEPNREKVRVLKQTLSSDIDAIVMNYVLRQHETTGEALALTKRNRIVKRSRNYQWIGIVHEYLNVTEGNGLISDAAVTHLGTGNHAGRNLQIIERWLASGGELQGRLRFHLACELQDSGRLEEAASHFEEFLRDPLASRDDLVMACARLAECYGQLGRSAEKLQTLLGSLYYDVPQSEICCSIGKCMEERQEWTMAVYWYVQALQTAHGGSWTGIVNQASRTWLPHSRLCLCYARLGQLQKAYEHNQAALRYLPDDPGLKDNEQKLKQALDAAATQ
ncbi:glycosyltransferase [Paenibacillus macerans]|uniref:glycosyltransferase family 2 protein n=1 Tax=Paenibacillus macerans TaxID=44252 RepID=UPI003D31A980